MAIFQVPDTTASPTATVESDYGSDLDDATVNDLLSQAASQPHVAASEAVIASIEDPVLDNAQPRVQRAVRFARTRIQDRTGATIGSISPTLKRTYTGPLREPSVEIEYDEQNRVAFSRMSGTHAIALRTTG